MVAYRGRRLIGVLSVVALLAATVYRTSPAGAGGGARWDVC